MLREEKGVWVTGLVCEQGRWSVWCGAQDLADLEVGEARDGCMGYRVQVQLRGHSSMKQSKY